MVPRRRAAAYPTGYPPEDLASYQGSKLVALSADAQKVLALLSFGAARATNTAFLVKQSDLDKLRVHSACDELVTAGLVVRNGRRIRRASSAAVTTELTKTAVRILDNIPVDGISIGGAALRSAVSVDNDSYRLSLHELQDKGLVSVGPGRGGSIRRSTIVEASPAVVSTGGATLERDLYQPFIEWLQSSWPATSGESLQEAMITATPKGYKRDSGIWTRPDVTELRVDRYELLPQGQRIQLELGSYEIKPKGVTRVEWVFEAAAHARWAHRSSLVLETPDMAWKADERIIGEVRRFNLGLYYMTLAQGRRYDIRIILEPGLQTPEPADLRDTIQRFLTSRKLDLMQRYRGVIG